MHHKHRTMHWMGHWMGSRALALLAALVLTGSLAPHAVAGEGDPDPEAIAQYCIEQIAQRTAFCVQRNVNQAEHCVAIIGELLANGHEQLAVHVAGHCVHRINHRSAHCMHRNVHQCQVCVYILNQLGAPELAEQVQAACAASIMAIQQSRAAAVEAIQNALP